MRPYIELLETVIFTIFFCMIWFSLKLGTNAELIIIICLYIICFEIAGLRKDASLTKSK